MKVGFHLPSLADHYRFNMVFASMLKNCPDYFREGVEISSFYGVFPPSVWNGGRIVRGRCNEGYINSVIKNINGMGIPIRFTFTNPLITEELLHDEFCNKVMKLADNGMNEVIVNSPLLEDYIREKYPNYKLTSSTCKRITDVDELKNELEKDYHLVVLDYDLNNRFDILETLPHKEKIELLTNACCDPECKMRSEHYRLMGEFMIYYNKHLKEHPERPFEINEYAEKNVETVIKCGAMNRSIYEIRGFRTHISPDDIWEKYVPMGFEQFKIEGRTASTLQLIETYMYYMIKPEIRDEARLMFMYNLERSGVIKVNS